MMKKIVLPLLILCSSWTSEAAYVPATVTSGFNHDVIANGPGNGSTPNQAQLTTTSAFDIPNSFAWLSADYQENASSATYSNALPLSGTINSVATAGLTFQLENYSQNNALLLSSSNTSGTLALSNAMNAAEVYLLTAAANGAVTFSATVQFSDLTTETFNSLSAKDWFSQSGFAINNLYWVNTTTGVVGVTANNPRLYAVKLTLSLANMGKTITDISITANISGTSNASMGVFAVSTNTACTGAPSPASISGPATGCPGDNVTYTATNAAGNGLGITYQWETSSPGMNTWTAVAGATGTTYNTTITGPMDIRYVATCNASAMSTPSNVLALAMKPLCYCKPAYTNNCGSNNKIRTVSIGSYTDPLGTGVCSQTSVPAVQLSVGTAPSVSVGTGAFVGLSASIDMGVDGNLATPGDIFYPNTYTATGSATYSFTLPVINNPGTYRLRIWCTGGNSGSGSSTNALPCDQYSYGNFRDYDLVYSNPLAITLGSIEVRNTGRSNIISWEVLMAEKEDRMELQRSADNFDFDALTVLNSDLNEKHYSYRDEAPYSGMNYYRLKLIDADGSVAFSKTVAVRAGAFDEITLAPNPARTVLNINGVGTKRYEYRLLNAIGQIIREETTVDHQIDVASLPQGVYYLRLLAGNEARTIRFIKE